MHGEGLGDLEEPDQLEAVQFLGPGFVSMDLGQPGINRWVAGDHAVDVGKPEVSAHRMHGGVDRRRHQASLTEMADVQLDVGTLDPDQRVELVKVAPAEPAPELGGVQGVGMAGVAGQVGDCGQLARVHVVRLERQQSSV